MSVPHSSGNRCITCIEDHWLVAQKKTYGYRERDEGKRRAYLEQLAQIPVMARVYVDESGMDERDDYDYGWCERGRRFEALKSGRRSGRVNMIAAYCQRNLMAPFTIEGSCNRVVFETWLETCLVPVLIEQALGQYVLYLQILDEMKIDRLLYLAVPQRTFNSVFKIELGQMLLKRKIIRLLVFDDNKEVLVRWIPD